jgi:hypothetical protein
MRDRMGNPQPGARAAFEAYGDHDAALVEASLPIYATWITASYLTALPRRPELAEPLAVQLRFLRAGPHR